MNPNPHVLQLRAADTKLFPERTLSRFRLAEQRGVQDPVTATGATPPLPAPKK